MTPNQPSGMTPKNPEPRQGLFGRIWARWQRIQRPAPATPYSPGLSALVDPFLATEAVSEADRPGAVAQAQRIRQLMDRVCATNNANGKNSGNRYSGRRERARQNTSSGNDTQSASSSAGSCARAEASWGRR